jgi:hypothetical protein
LFCVSNEGFLPSYGENVLAQAISLLLPLAMGSDTSGKHTLWV